MSKLNFLLFILLMNYSISSQAISYIMKLSSGKEAAVLGYYKGQKLKFDQNMCLFQDSEKSATFILVVTDQVIYKRAAHKNTYLERIEDKPCKIYYFTQQDNNRWRIEEENIEDMPNRLADSAFVLLLDPKNIEKIDSEINLSSDSCICLPKIYLKDNLDLNTDLNLIALNSLDSNSVHSQTNDIKISNNIALITLRDTYNV